MTLTEGAPRRLHPAAILGDSFRALPGALAGLAGSVSFARDRSWGALLMLGGLILLAAAVYSVLSWWRFRYWDGDGEIVIERGLLSRQRRVIPFDRVQDVSIERPLLARLIGTARVRIETGGGGADEGDLSMISLAEAQRLRDRIRHARPTPAGPVTPGACDDAPTPAPEPVVFAMGLGRVVGSGLLSFSLLFIAVATGALQYVDDLGLFKWREWAQSDAAEAVAGRIGPRELAAVATLVVLLGLVTGVVRTLLRDFRFTLTVGESGLRRRRGLLTLSEVVIPRRRTQAARIASGWLSGSLGWRTLAFQTLGADREGGGVQEAAPFARMTEVEAILGHAGFPAPSARPDLTRAPTRALARRCGPWLMLATAAALTPLPALSAAPALMALAQAQRWRRNRHMVGARALTVTAGLIGHIVWIIPFEKLQTLWISRTPLQRRLGLATLLFDTAGASMMAEPAIVDVPLAEAEALAARLLGNFYMARAALRRQPPPSLVIEKSQ